MHSKRWLLPMQSLCGSVPVRALACTGVCPEGSHWLNRSGGDAPVRRVNMEGVVLQQFSAPSQMNCFGMALHDNRLFACNNSRLTGSASLSC
jgi:hypothetical protein